MTVDPLNVSTGLENATHAQLVEEILTLRQQNAELKQADARLKASEAELRSLFEAMTDLVLVVDSSGCFLKIAPTHTNEAYRPSDALVGKTLHELLPAEQAEFFLDVIRRALATGQAQTTEFELTVAGLSLWFSATLSPLMENCILGVARDITERKRNEQALLQSEHKYRTLMEQASEAIVIIDDQGYFVEINSKGEELSGYSREELLKLNIVDLIDPEDFRQQPIDLASLRSGLTTRTERWIRKKDGSRIPVEISSKMLDDGMHLSIAHDISERKLNQERQTLLDQANLLLASNLDYDTALKGLASLLVPRLADHCSIVVVEDDGSYRTVDLAVRSPETLPLVAQLDDLYRRKSKQSSSGLDEVLQTGATVYAPHVDYTKIAARYDDPQMLDWISQLGIQSALLVALKARGRILGAISLNMAESGRHYQPADRELAEELARRAGLAIDNAWLYRQTENARRNAEMVAQRIVRLQAATAALSEVLAPSQAAEVTLQQALTTLNAAAGAMLWLSDDSLTLEIIYTLGYPPDVVDTWRFLRVDAPGPLPEAMRTGQPIWFETFEDRIARYPDLEGSIRKTNLLGAWMAVPLVVDQQIIGVMDLSFAQPSRFTDEDHAYILALARQCAQSIQRAHLYDSEWQARTQAEAAIRARDEFLSVAAHELRTPVTSLIGFSQTIQRRLQRDGMLDLERVQRMLDVVEQQSSKLSRLIAQLLDVSRLDSGRLKITPEWVDIMELVGNVVMGSQTTTTRHTISLRGPSAAQALVDPLRFEQVMTNLLDNAIKYSPDGGLIAVDLSTSPAGVIQICVTDSGIGIAPEHRAHIFERFYQGHSSTTVGGLGLGLFISHQIIQLHGGQIQAESPDSGGTRFVITLPGITESGVGK